MSSESSWRFSFFFCFPNNGIHSMQSLWRFPSLSLALFFFSSFLFFLFLFLFFFLLLSLILLPSPPKKRKSMVLISQLSEPPGTKSTSLVVCVKKTSLDSRCMREKMGFLIVKMILLLLLRRNVIVVRE